MNKDQLTTHTNRALVSLGSNIDKEQNLPRAVALLAELCDLLAVSSVYETEPVGLLDQPVFWNAAALIRTEFSPGCLKSQVLVAIEKRLGRVRQGDKNAPRTIDADLTLYNRQIIDMDADHHLPDPDLLTFAHVALPAAELLPDEHHPETGRSYARIAEELTSFLVRNQQPFPRKIFDFDIMSNVKQRKSGTA